MIKKILRKIDRILEKPKVYVPVTTAFLQSDVYEELMTRHLPYPGTYDIHEAQNRTANFRFRHHEKDHVLGVFRWRGIHKHKELILKLITEPGAVVVDLGGAAGPLGLNSTVVDFLPKDAYGRDVPYRSLQELSTACDVIFTSHTLEHIPPLESVIQEVKEALKAGGYFIVHVPSFYCERWRHGIHTNALYNDHHWTFGLAGSDTPADLQNYLDIDQLLAKYFHIEIAEYCGDDSIFILCKKKTV